ncbi:MAG TPA: hypothetical protein VN952_00095, partial [Chthoniobacterales bacterium]|nr:hypothetical protein [Chthoniobacterales bacterium]
IAKHPAGVSEPGVFIFWESSATGITIRAGKMIAMANNKVAGGSQSAILKRRSTPFAGLFRPALRTWLLASKFCYA